MAIRSITLHPNSGVAGEIQFLYYDTGTGRFYTAQEGSVSGDPLDQLFDYELPTRECFAFAGFWSSSSSSGGYLRINADGTFAAGWAPTSSTTIYARWTRVSYKITINANGGAGGTAAFYRVWDAPAGYAGVFSSGDQIVDSLTRIEPPSREGHSFAGLWSSASGGTMYADARGEFENALYDLSVTSDKTIYAHWTGNTYTLSFDFNGGAGSAQPKSVTFGENIGALPTATLTEGTFAGWYVNGAKITATSTWRVAGDAVAVAHYNYYFGRPGDFFGLDSESGPLMLVESNDGATRAAVETAGSSGSGSSLRCGLLAIQSGDSAVGAFAVGGTLLNPTCTYRVRKAGDVALTLGKAFGAATISGNAATVSGYMLVSARYTTSADGEPTLVVVGTANEGYVCDAHGVKSPRLTDAINQWTVSLRVSPDHIAQDPFGAVSGGGELTECETALQCVPVVPTEDGMPCASDVVCGKLVVTATTAAYFGESAPTANSSNRFFEVNAVPRSESDVDFATYSIVAERSL